MNSSQLNKSVICSSLVWMTGAWMDHLTCCMKVLSSVQMLSFLITCTMISKQILSLFAHHCRPKTTYKPQFVLILETVHFLDHQKFLNSCTHITAWSRNSHELRSEKIHQNISNFFSSIMHSYLYECIYMPYIYIYF